MDAFKFLKRHLGLGNGDLMLLYAFKHDWVITAPDARDDLPINHAHTYYILNSFSVKGMCRKEKPPEAKRYHFIFNGKSKSIVEHIFNEKILPHMELPPDEFKDCTDLELQPAIRMS